MHNMQKPTEALLKVIKGQRLAKGTFCF